MANINTFPAYAKTFQANLGKFAQEFAAEFQARVEQKTPVRTGLLKASWSNAVTPESITLNNSTDYAIYVEEGTPKMSPVGMVSTTILESEDIMRIAIQRSGIK